MLESYRAHLGVRRPCRKLGVWESYHELQLMTAEGRRGINLRSTWEVRSAGLGEEGSWV